jgi:3-phenylpropionate/trans-cinnamate dioxygenase ferredoxin reductase subunit
VVRGSVEDRSFVAFYMKEGRVQAAVSMDRGSEMQQSMALIRTGGTVDAKTLRDETRDLSALSS